MSGNQNIDQRSPGFQHVQQAADAQKAQRTMCDSCELLSNRKLITATCAIVVSSWMAFVFYLLLHRGLGVQDALTASVPLSTEQTYPINCDHDIHALTCSNLTYVLAQTFNISHLSCLLMWCLEGSIFYLSACLLRDQTNYCKQTLILLIRSQISCFCCFFMSVMFLLVLQTIFKILTICNNKVWTFK